jgi:uncharacterized protein YndB with AHSA1/START domain
MNSSFDLHLERLIDVPKEAVWRCWTEPALLLPWFCPLPWKTIACEIELRPGGVFSSTMQSPEGETMPTNSGCILEVVPNRRFTWTNALLPDYRPSLTFEQCGTDDPGFMFTATIELDDHPTATGMGTRYRVRVQHANEAGAQKHAAMGFEAGWGAALDQMVSMIHKGL